jgi:hypothetical protein
MIDWGNQPLERTDAFKTLRLDSSADGRMVENAYWTLVRQAQRRSASETEAGGEIDRLNEAYTVLAPDAKPVAQPRSARIPGAGTGTGVAFMDAFADWCASEALKTRQRWAGRNPEIAVIAGAVLVMFLFAAGAGATLPGIFLPLVLIVVAIWAPWRKLP